MLQRLLDYETKPDREHREHEKGVDTRDCGVVGQGSQQQRLQEGGRNISPYSRNTDYGWCNGGAESKNKSDVDDVASYPIA
jgi:hypothetical protein